MAARYFSLANVYYLRRSVFIYILPLQPAGTWLDISEEMFLEGIGFFWLSKRVFGCWETNNGGGKLKFGDFHNNYFP